MRKCFVLLLCAMHAHATTTQVFRENADVAVNLSHANYNRLVVRDDKITKAHFPEGSMVVKSENDGSLYVMAALQEPFTLFLTTEKGHHFSATVSSEKTLGKTVEFIPQLIHAQPNKTKTKTIQPPAAVRRLITQMMQQTEPADFAVRHHYGRGIRLQQGLVMFPKLTYQGIELNGEVLALYNRGSKPVHLVEAWFAGDLVKAVALSESWVAPKQRVFVYRVLEHHHG